MSLHHLVIMIKLSRSCLLCFLCMLAIPIFFNEYTKEALISPEIRTEWKTFRSYLSKQPKGTLYSQLAELTTSDMLRTMFPNISTLANICLSVSIPVSTASVERSFSQLKLIKTRIRNRIGQSSLSYLMKIAIETPEKLSDSDLDAIISVWNRKPSCINVLYCCF